MPTSAHSVRYADIEYIGAIGDSLTVSLGCVPSRLWHRARFPGGKRRWRQPERPARSAPAVQRFGDLEAELDSVN